MGEVRYGPTSSEMASLQFRRSIYICQDLNEGDVLTSEHVRIVRPGYGLPPKSLAHVLGRTLRRAAPKGTALTWDLI